MLSTRVKGESEALETDKEQDEDLTNEWEFARDTANAMIYEGGSNILVLTRGLVYGTELLYDTDNRMYYLDDSGIRTGVRLIYK
jgi:hypothetical protein